MATASKFDINQFAAIAAGINGQAARAAGPVAKHQHLNHLQEGLHQANAPDKPHLTPWSRFMLKWEESGLARKAEAGIARHRWGEIEAFVKENINAEVNLLRQQSKEEFSTRFAAISERAMASEAVATTSIRAAAEAGLDLIYRDVYERLQSLAQMNTLGELDDQAFRERVASTYRFRDAAVANLEASCTAKVNAVRDAFNSR